MTTRNLTPLHDPHQVFNDLFHTLDNEFHGLFRRGPLVDLLGKSVFPKVNHREHGSDYVLEVAIPYYDPKDVRVLLEKGLLSVHAEEITPPEGTYVMKEVSHRAFTRSWQLPNGITKDRISSRYSNGVLYITIKDVTGKPSTVQKAPEEIKIEV